MAIAYPGEMHRPLRGRRHELALVGDALARARGGQTSTLVFVGEPGIGKSRLAIEAAARAGAEGVTVLWGRGWEAGGAPPYWPWRQLCESLPREGPINQLWGRRGESATDPDAARFELFDAVAHALSAAARRTPLLCILDDLHTADVPSLELLAFATRHLRATPLVWLLTWRDVEGARVPVREPLARIAREATVTALAALSPADANELIDDVQRDADTELRARLVRATGGNPLFLLETLTALATGHVHASELVQLPIAQGIAAIVRDRLEPLSATTRALAAAASVVGRDVSLARWAAAADRPDDVDGVRRGAAALVEAGFMAELGHDRWRFGHDLVRETIYRGAADTVEIHARLARALDAQVAAGDVSVIGSRAHHALHAALDVRTIIDWTIAAADHARGQCAYEEAIAVIETATVRLGAAAHADAALQLARGRALLDLGDHDRARDAFTTAMTLARRAGDAPLAALAALGYGRRYVFGEHLHELIAMIDQADAALPDDARVLHARLLARKAAALTPPATPEPVLGMAREAYDLVRDSADDAARLEVAVAVGATFADFAHPHERVPINETVVALARACGDRALELRGLSRLVTDHIQAGDLARADAALIARDALARALVQPRFAWLAPLFRSMRAMIVGDLAVCDAAVAEAAELAAHDPNASRVCATHRFWLYLHADRADALRAHERAFVDAVRTMPEGIVGLGHAIVALRAGDRDTARRELAAMHPEWHHGRAINHLATLAEVVAEVGTADERHRMYELLAPFADCYAAWGLFGLSCGPPVASLLGHLAAAGGDVERAAAHFDSAYAMTTRIGAIVGRAWTGYWHARMLAATEDAQAARVLATTIADATTAGMTGLVDRCRSVAAPREPATQTIAPTPPAAAPLAFTIVEQAGTWVLTRGDRRVLAPNLRGMAMLARLVDNPHVEVHSLELVSGSAQHDWDTGDAGELLDDRARTAYRNRLAELADRIEDAESRGDADAALAATDEQERLLQELSRAVGKGGKVRRAGVAGERARITAQRRLRDAVRKIAELDADLGAHLTAAVRTGTFCAYRPPPG